MPELSSKTANAESIKEQVDAALTRIIENQERSARATDVRYGRLWATIREIALAGGKRIRPYLTVVTYYGFGGTNPAIIEAAAAQELLHLSLLFHDDIMDHDYIRHGVPNVAGRYLEYYQGQADVSHLADSAAILAGDLLLGLAYETVSTTDFEPHVRTRAIRALGRAVHEVAGGQLLDMEAAGLDGTTDESLKIARLKTASYSFVGPLMMGAILAEAGEQELATLEVLGTALGVGFQLADDLIGLFGDAAEAGKPVISDLREGKSTYLIRQAFALCSPQDRAWLESAWGSADVTLADLDHARHIVTECGARAATEAVLQQQATLARDAVAALNISADVAATLSKMIDRAMWRRV
jgi:geranylgeranyl diphosphate synthase type I